MSRAAIRQQIYDYLSAATITDLNVVHKSFPTRIQFQDGATAGQLNRCQAVIFIDAQDESRIAFGGDQSGWKRIDYQVSIQLFHHSVLPDAVQVMDAFDQTVDEMVAYLRDDHRFGDPNGTIIWQAAEPSINIDFGEPMKINSGATETWCAIKFIVTEMVAA